MSLTEKLREIAEAKSGGKMPSCLGVGDHGWGWGEALSKIAADALVVIERRWQPIETAPVPPREELMHGRWRCLLQDRTGYVTSGYAAYARTRERSVKNWRLQWYWTHGRVFEPIYWMPLPAAKEES